MHQAARKFVKADEDERGKPQKSNEGNDVKPEGDPINARGGKID
jgi:hypothetical protein